MKFQISQDFTIESARFLPHLPKSHPCSRMHGHSFRIRLILAGELDPQLGWLIDYNDVVRIAGPVMKSLDHQVLNEVEGLSNPTTELLAQWIYNRLIGPLPQLIQVVINETPQSQVAYPC
ncbi:MAG TPA: 6-carboxytetrahydropterin synthase [Pseudobdellovibrionaceae bacterium]|jgi:6-pyruvoyltetrahydropterin/6-carboxytetrahydropterin synthase|nr:6-carboxytetrahydropterin synthase [Pseudobdellovibrionaceae bacterium]